jgi:hypothetical protein
MNWCFIALHSSRLEHLGCVMPSPAHSRLRAIFLILPIFLASADALQKYKHWFHRSQVVFGEVSTDVCNVTYNRFQDKFDELGGAAWIDLALRKPNPVYDYCSEHMTCILSNILESKNASLSSSNVVLGLLPTLLAVVSPSIAELALLSTHRPILSSLISLGSPGVLQTRVFSYEDPAETLDLPDNTHAITRLALALGPWSYKTSVVVSAVEYIAVAASGINMIWLSYELGTRAICSWGCTMSWPPLLWALFPFVIYALGVYSYRLTLDASKRSYSIADPSSGYLNKQSSFFTSTSTSDTAQVSSNTIGGQPEPQKTTALPFSNDIHASANQHTTPHNPSFLSLIKRELLPCAAHPLTVINTRLPLSEHTTRAKFGIFVNCIAGFLSCMHLLYGTIVFSSFNFIDIPDAIGIVAMRFLASSVACRLVILVEIAGIRGARVKLVAEGIAQTEAIAEAAGGGGWAGAGEKLRPDVSVGALSQWRTHSHDVGIAR